MIEVFQTILLFAIVVFLARQHGSGKQARKSKVIILDSCGLIDGRILDLTSTLFIDATLVVPQFVLDELQLLADGRDTHKRERARYGLEVASELQKQPGTTLMIDKSVTNKGSTTDEYLILLAQKRRAILYTTDYALNKRAVAENVTVLNVNEVAQSLRPVALPGETNVVKILKKGEVREQGIGYLEDGTMIVVEGAARSVGKSVEVSITRTLQSEAGKMMFARLIPGPPRSSR